MLCRPRSFSSTARAMPLASGCGYPRVRPFSFLNNIGVNNNSPTRRYLPTQDDSNGSHPLLPTRLPCVPEFHVYQKRSEKRVTGRVVNVQPIVQAPVCGAEAADVMSTAVNLRAYMTTLSSTSVHVPSSCLGRASNPRESDHSRGKSLDKSGRCRVLGCEREERSAKVWRETAILLHLADVTTTKEDSDHKKGI